MTTRPLQRILITNDDGIDAPGLAALVAVAKQIAQEVWVVAPDHDQSGISHAISLHHPLRVTKKADRIYSVSGTPADCVAMAVGQLMPSPPDLLLSGINKGANMGIETMFSGTVGGAMAGLLLGIPSIALSQALTRRDAVRWETATQLAPGVILQLWDMGWDNSACLNVNFPDVAPELATPMQITTQGTGRMDGVSVTSRSDLREQDYYWLNVHRKDWKDVEGTETFVVLNGGISVTPLQFERTALELKRELENKLAQS